MLAYISIILYVYFIILYLKKYPTLAIFIFTTPIMIFSALRGSSGKDSELYLLRFSNMSNDWGEFSLFDEPILNSLIFLSKHIFGGTHELFFLFHSGLICFLFTLIVKKYEASRVYLLTVGPMFLIDGITNGMRITLAYHFFIVAALYRRQVIVGGLVMLSHVTGGLMYVFQFIIDNNRVTVIKRIILFFSFLVLAYIASLYLDRFLIFMPRIASKLDKYSIMVLSTKYSGIVDIFMMVTIFILSVWCRVKNRIDLLLGICLAIILGITFYILVQNSLAFIRVGKLFIVALCLSSFATNASKKIPFFALLVLGCIYSLNFIRQVILGGGFLPYPGVVH